MLLFFERASIDVRSSDATRGLLVKKKKKKNLPRTLRIRPPSSSARAAATPSGYVIPAVARNRVGKEIPRMQMATSFFLFPVVAASSHAGGHRLVVHRATE